MSDRLTLLAWGCVFAILAVPYHAFALYCPNFENDCSTPSVEGTNPSVAQWNDIFALVSGGPEAWGNLAPGVQSLTRGCNQPEAPHAVPARFPIEVLKAIAMHESSWTQFCVPNINQSGGPSRTIISFDCGYGVGQVTSGMRKTDATPDYDRHKVAADALYNMAVGTRILASKWQSANCVGDRNPDIIEDWYAAIWAYNGFAVINNPNHPNYASNRGVWNPSVNNPAPYQEKIFGRMEHPPGPEYWDPVQVAYPDITEIAAANGKPGALSEPSCATPTNCTQKRPVHLTATVASQDVLRGMAGNMALSVILGDEETPTQLVAKSPNGLVYATQQDPTDGHWGNFQALAQGALCGVTGVKRRGVQQELSLFASTKTGSSLQVITQNGTWQPATSFGGTDIRNAQAIAWPDGRLDVFVLGGDGKIYQRSETLPNQWQYWVSLDGNMQHGPAAVTAAGNRAYVFATDKGGEILYRHRASSSSGWTTWQGGLGDHIASRPIPIPMPDGSVEIFARSVDNTLMWGRVATDESQSMSALSQTTIQGDPTVIRVASGPQSQEHVWVIARDAQDGWLGWQYDGDNWEALNDLPPLGTRTLGSDPYAWVDAQDILHIAMIDGDGHLQITRRDGSTWRAWTTFSTPSLDTCTTPSSDDPTDPDNGGNGTEPDDNGNGDNGTDPDGNGNGDNGTEPDDNGNGDNGTEPDDNGNGEDPGNHGVEPGNNDNGTQPGDDNSAEPPPSWGTGSTPPIQHTGCACSSTDVSPASGGLAALVMLALVGTRKRRRPVTIHAGS